MTEALRLALPAARFPPPHLNSEGSSSRKPSLTSSKANQVPLSPWVPIPTPTTLVICLGSLSPAPATRLQPHKGTARAVSVTAVSPAQSRCWEGVTDDRTHTGTGRGKETHLVRVLAATVERVRDGKLWVEAPAQHQLEQGHLVPSQGLG